MADYTHLHHLKINEVREDQFNGLDGNQVESISGFWPASEVVHPTVGWVLSLSVERDSALMDLLQDIGDEDSDASVEQLEAFVKEENKKQRSNRLVKDPAERARLTQSNLKMTLDWLRLEPYSTVDVMALVLNKSTVATRRILNKFVKEGWLIRDEIDWIGPPGRIHLFGISSIGLYHLLDDGGYEPPSSRDFKRKRTKASGGAHILNLQLARLYFERCDCVGTSRRFRLARDLPYFQTQVKAEQINQWWTYPDAVVDSSHVMSRHGHPLSLAIEIEQHPKGTKRYRDLIKRHWMNINADSDRYDRVVYILPDADKRDALQRAFHAHIDHLYLSDEAVNVKQAFLFDTYADLGERIQALG